MTHATKKEKHISVICATLSYFKAKNFLLNAVVMNLIKKYDSNQFLSFKNLWMKYADVDGQPNFQASYCKVCLV